MTLLFRYDKGIIRQGDLDMEQNKITNLPDPTSDEEPVTKSNADANCAGGGGGGPNGDKGDAGAQGPEGDKGDVGLQGLEGDKGHVGLQRSKGDKGDVGLQGPKGDKGDVGLQGPKGDVGLQGPKGGAGVQGPPGSGGMSLTGFTMQGDIDMSSNKITNLPAPTADADRKFKTEVLTSHGFVMKDVISMNGHKIIGLPEPVTDTEPATNKWVAADFPTKKQILNAFTMNGIFDWVDILSRVLLRQHRSLAAITLRQKIIVIIILQVCLDLPCRAISI